MPTTPIDPPNAVAPSSESSSRSPWLTVREAAERARCSTKFVYAQIKRGKLRAARLGVRGELRLHRDWIDAWIVSATVLNPDTPCADFQPNAPFGRRR